MTAISRAVNNVAAFYQFPRIQVTCTDTAIDLALLEGQPDNAVGERHLAVSVGPKTIHIDQKVKNELRAETPLCVWNDAIERNAEAFGTAKTAINDHRGFWAQIALCGGTLMLVFATGGAAAPLVGVYAGSSLTAAAVGAGAGAVIGSAAGGIHANGVCRDNEQMKKVIAFVESLKRTYDRIQETHNVMTPQQIAALLAAASSTADAAGGSAVYLMDECIQKLTQSRHPQLLQTVAAYYEIRRTRNIQRGTTTAVTL